MGRPVLAPGPGPTPSPCTPAGKIRSALPPSFVASPARTVPPKAAEPVRVDIVETQASVAREAYLAERLAQIDSWAYDQKPWGPAEMPVPSSLPFGRDPRARVRKRVEEVMREIEDADAANKKNPNPNPSLMPNSVTNSTGTQSNLHPSRLVVPQPGPGETPKAKKRLSMISFKSVTKASAVEDKEPMDKAAKRLSVLSTKPLVEDPTLAPTMDKGSSSKRFSMLSIKSAADTGAPAPAQPNLAPPRMDKRSKRSSIFSLKSLRDRPERTVSPVPPVPPVPADARLLQLQGPPSAFKRLSMRNTDAADIAAPPPHPAPVPAIPTHAKEIARSKSQPDLRRSRRWSLHNLRGVLSRDSNSNSPPTPLPPPVPTVNNKTPTEAIITHLPERMSSSVAREKRRHTPGASGDPEATLPSPTMSLVSLDLDFDVFGLSSDSQSIKTPPTPPESSSAHLPAPGPHVGVTDSPLPISEVAATPHPQLQAERDAWRHEALLLYDQLSYWRLEALERGRERDGWRGVALAAGVHVPPSVVKTLPVVTAPLSEAQRRTRELEREREKGSERVREWHLASIERERREHERKLAERRAAERDAAERKEFERRVLRQRAMERDAESLKRAVGVGSRDLERRQAEWKQYERRKIEMAEHDWHREMWATSPQKRPKSQVVPMALPHRSAAAAAAAADPHIAGTAGVGSGGSWGRRQSKVAPVAPSPPRAIGWPECESGNERARILSHAVASSMQGGTWPRHTGAMYDKVV